MRVSSRNASELEEALTGGGACNCQPGRRVADFLTTSLCAFDMTAIRVCVLRVLRGSVVRCWPEKNRISSGARGGNIFLARARQTASMHNTPTRSRAAGRFAVVTPDSGFMHPMGGQPTACLPPLSFANVSPRSLDLDCSPHSSVLLTPVQRSTTGHSSTHIGRQLCA